MSDFDRFIYHQIAEDNKKELEKEKPQKPAFSKPATIKDAFGYDSEDGESSLPRQNTVKKKWPKREIDADIIPPAFLKPEEEEEAEELS